MKKVARDPRIDFIRGIALMSIYAIHIDGNILRQRIGLSDSADVFVLVSGYICGYVYYRLLQGVGFYRCQRKAVYRCVQLYIAHVLTMFIFLGLLCSLQSHWSEYLSPPYLEHVDRYASEPLLVCAEIVTLQYSIGHFGILPLYMLFLLVLPAMLSLFQIHRWLMLLPVIVLYAATQLCPTVDLFLSQWRTVWHFNPLAWQLLFFGGAAFGASAFGARNAPNLNGDFWPPLLVVLAGTGLEIFFLMRVIPIGIPTPLVDKINLGPLRVLNLVCLVIVLSRVLPQRAEWYERRILQPFMSCGQNALFVYCFGNVLALVASMTLMAYGHSTALFMVVNIGGWMSCSMCAYIWRMICDNMWKGTVSVVGSAVTVHTPG